ncbi:LysR family transcriptional regulator [Paracoccus aminophilus]|uniref:Transcriptional regulator, LysR family n=1 Tax=Paracoccus aminophilus JCM 7686 TaxID=1367847 RepID=S5Y569_PARAH|nr:LysR family transcriptional regulator [Paracoccus aminophilus]AGT10875.1 transcriptional regulator, LysR family [Paracoccus aminophilus JCM 7686]
MEARQLAQFLMACQCASHQEAALAAGVSRSTLSEAIAGLEAELGLTLFRRSGRAILPGPAGRWLFQEAADLLGLIEALARFPGAAQPLRIVSPLRFMFGRLYRASVPAARALNAQSPAILPRIRFASPYAAGLDVAGGYDDADLRLAYADLTAPGDVFLFDDDWVAVEGGTGDGPPEIWLPPLPEGESARIRDYCRANGLPDPAPVEEDVGVLARLGQARARTWLLAPYSLVAHGVAGGALPVHRLTPPLTSPVMAQVLSREPATMAAAEAFIALIRARIDLPPEPQLFAPAFTLRDLVAVDRLAKTGNTTRAARHLNITQPALSAALARVEETLGRPLFRRHSRGVTPVDPALDLIAEIAARIAGITQEARHVALQERQEVVIGHSAAAMLCPEIAGKMADGLAEWQRLLPGVKLRLIEAPARRLDLMLRAGELGIAIFDAPEGAGPGQRLCALGRLCQIGTGALVLPAEDEGIAMLSGLRSGVQGASLPLCAALARAGGATLLPERLARALAPDLPAHALQPARAMILRTSVTTDRSLGEAEQLLLSCLRRAFAGDDASDQAAR